MQLKKKTKQNRILSCDLDESAAIDTFYLEPPVNYSMTQIS